MFNGFKCDTQSIVTCFNDCNDLNLALVMVEFKKNKKCNWQMQLVCTGFAEEQSKLKFMYWSF